MVCRISGGGLMAGKKFTAAEKHFHKKEVEYQKTIKELRARVQDLSEQLDYMSRRCDTLQSTVSTQQRLIKECESHADMTKEELQTHIKDTAKAAEAVRLFTGLGMRV